MLRLYHLLIGLIIIPVGAGVGLTYLSSRRTVEPTPAATVTPTTSTKIKVAEENIWKSILSDTAAPTNWQVTPCKENTRLLCVFSFQKLLGTVEMVVYPLQEQPKFAKMLMSAGITPSKEIDSNNPNIQEQVAAALNVWVGDRYSELLQNRQGIYGDNIAFSHYPPQKASIGKLEGIQYGFTGLTQTGEVYEQHLSFVAFDGKSLYVITTAFNPAAQTGKFEKLEHLATFEPYLTQITSKLKLPRLGDRTL